MVIPSFNPDERLIEVIGGLWGRGFSRILVVNDGCGSEYSGYFERAESLGCEVISHAVNLGKGRALKTAYNYLLNKYGEDVLAVFADSDGQHSAEDIMAVAQKLAQNKDSLVMGCREFEDKAIPARSRVGNKVTRKVLSLLCGVRVSDTQTGLRGLSGKSMKKFLVTKGERFEFEMNMLIEAGANDVKIVEVPIKTIYIEENKTSHFNPFRDSLRIYSVFVKFLLSSTASFLVDILLFSLLEIFFEGRLDKYYSILYATLAARICSSLINYTINKNTVFKVTSKRSYMFFRYYTLCAVQLICSWLLVFSTYSLLPFIPETLIKIVVDLVLFIISFQIQREWVFKK